MKKLLGIVVLGLLCFTINSSQAEDFAAWGPTGNNCNTMNKLLNDYGEEGKAAVTGSIQGFLSGINTQLIIDGKSESVRAINHNSLDFILSYMNEYCRKNKDGNVIVGLLRYFKTLPLIK